MSKSKKTLCLLLALLLALISSSAAFCSAAEDAPATTASALTVQVEMSRVAYFVTSKAKATVRVQNTGSEALKDVHVCAYSEKHLLPAGNESMLLIPELGAGKTAEYSFSMVLDRSRSGVSFFERVLLFFAQLFRSYAPLTGIPPMGETVVTKEVSFRHGSANTTLNVEAWYQSAGAENPDDPPRPQVTYLDKYVIDILESGSYTAQMGLPENGSTLQITMYMDTYGQAIELPVTNLLVRDLELPEAFARMGKIRIILKDIDTNPHAYLAWTGGYYELEDIQDAAEMIKSLSSEDIRQQLQIDKLEYRGKSSEICYVRETYLLPEENIQYDFYFTKTSDYEGCVRWDVIDLNAQETTQTNIRLMKGITDPEAFNVSGKKYDLADFERMFG